MKAATTTRFSADASDYHSLYKQNSIAFTALWGSPSGRKSCLSTLTRVQALLADTRERTAPCGRHHETPFHLLRETVCCRVPIRGQFQLQTLPVLPEVVCLWELRCVHYHRPNKIVRLEPVLICSSTNSSKRLNIWKFIKTEVFKDWVTQK